LNPDIDTILIDCASPFDPRVFIKDIEVFRFADNVGAINKGGKDGAGRSITKGMEIAVERGYDYVCLHARLTPETRGLINGEIRDFETAEIAIKAALTGQLVLSTLHTNDAPGSITRLINMGIEPFLVSSSLNIIQAQRLVRKVCQSCKEPENVPIETLVELGMSKEQAEQANPQKGKGCSVCGNTGYKGRIAVYEILPITEEVRNCIISGMSDLEIKRMAMSS
jgi:hypothetical protein